MPEYLKALGGGLALLLSSGLIQYFINRHDAKKGRMDDLEIKIGEVQEDLTEKIKSVNDERERVGKERYEEHEEKYEVLRESLLKVTQTQEEMLQVQKASNELLKGLAQNTLVHLSNAYLERGYITTDELGVLNDIYEPYSSPEINGNGRGKVAIERCEELAKKHNVI